MAATPGYNGNVLIAGTSTAITGEATTDVGGTHTAYQITDATKRVLDPNTSPVVKVDGTPVSSANWRLDMLFGTILFTVARAPSAVVTFDGAYLPMEQVATARSLDYQISADLIDNTTFASAQQSGGEKSRIYGMQDASGTIEVLEDLLTDHDPSGDGRTLRGVLTGQQITVLELYQSTAEKFRAFVAFDQASLKSQPADQIVGSVSWKLAAVDGRAGFRVGT